MEFQKEFDILTKIDPSTMLEIAFEFQNHSIKVYFNQNERNGFLILVCENESCCFIRNYGIFFKDKIAQIDGYWGKYFEYAKGLQSESNFKFTDFYNKLKESIQAVENPTPGFGITYLNVTQGLTRISTITQNSVNPTDRIYFNHIRRSPISPKQFKIVENILGKDAANYLKQNDLTAVFTSEIFRQKRFVLIPD